MPDELPNRYALGSEDEAVLIADELAKGWRATSRAGWLRAARWSAKKERERKRKGRRR